MIARRPGRDLDAAELLATAMELAVRRELWAHLVEHEPDRRRYHELLRDPHLAAWLICWTNEQDTGFHDHDVSAGAVAVVEGRLREDRLALGGRPSTRLALPGTAFCFSAADIHRVRHEGEDPAVSLHVYSPPLWRMGAYEVGPDGRLRRHSISYAEELRPVAGVTAP